MRLTNNHRSALLAELEAALIEKETIKYILNSEAAKESLQFSEATEIKEFLNNQKIEILRASIIDEEIDY